MADRRKLVSTTAIISAVPAAVYSLWCYSHNGRVNETFGRADKAMWELENLTATEVYLYVYSVWGGPAFFVFVLVWHLAARLIIPNNNR